VALREVAEIRRGRGTATIRRRDQRRVITVTAELMANTDVQSADANAELRERLQPLIAANPDVRFEFGGEYEETQESLNSLFLAFLVAAQEARRPRIDEEVFEVGESPLLHRVLPARVGTDNLAGARVLFHQHGRLDSGKIAHGQDLVGAQVDLDLAHAVTCHKAQGSSAKRIVASTSPRCVPQSKRVPSKR